jgi:hypothetical protein
MARIRRTPVKSATRKPKAQPMTVVRLGLDHLVSLAREEAVRRSGGDASRVEVIDATTFRVR